MADFPVLVNRDDGQRIRLMYRPLNYDGENAILGIQKLEEDVDTYLLNVDKDLKHILLSNRIGVIGSEIGYMVDDLKDYLETVRDFYNEISELEYDPSDQDYIKKIARKEMALKLARSLESKINQKLTRAEPLWDSYNKALQGSRHGGKRKSKKRRNTSKRKHKKTKQHTK